MHFAKAFSEAVDLKLDFTGMVLLAEYVGTKLSLSAPQLLEVMTLM